MPPESSARPGWPLTRPPPSPEVRRAGTVPVLAGAVPRPRAFVRRFSVGAGRKAFDAAWVVPPDPQPGLIVLYPGYNVPLTAWELTKAALLADAWGRPLIEVELPGMSRHGGSLDAAARLELQRAGVERFAELTNARIAAALDVVGVRRGGPVVAVGYSTGASVAAQSLGWLAGRSGGLEGVVLVEPVGILPRPVPVMFWHNVLDWRRRLAEIGRNEATEWALGQYLAPEARAGVRIAALDSLVVAFTLSAETIPGAVLSAAVRTDLVRGELSALCPADALARLDDRLDAAGVPGDSLTVPGLGHGVWHNIAAVAGIAGRLGTHSQRKGQR